MHLISIWNHVFVFFFFSSRRRHTRLQGDWSSDECSSDLAAHHLAGAIQFRNATPTLGAALNPRQVLQQDGRALGAPPHGHGAEIIQRLERSEERRVGKECRSRWSPYH